ncbi:MAG: hypothetical protein R3B57_04645 [Phycisphaerales bacterium]
MKVQEASRGWLAAGGVFSLLVHVAGGLLAVAWAHGEPGGASTATPTSEPLLERKKPDVVLGIQESRSVSINWLGFETPTEHRAQVAETEQPALSMAPMGETPEAVSGSGGDGSSARAPIAPGELQATAGGVVGPPAPSESAPAIVVRPKESEDAQIAASPDAGSLDLPPARDPLQGAGGGGGKGEEGAPAGGDDQPGQPSDRESVATALREAMNLSDWGKPLAREGLEIKTVRPRWSVTTRLSRSPRNPVVVIQFGRDGVVRTARFLREGKFEYSTGFDDVDGPLLDAVYRWKAEGKALEPLDEAQTLQVSVRVVLRG